MCWVGYIETAAMCLPITDFPVTFAQGHPKPTERVTICGHTLPW